MPEGSRSTTGASRRRLRRAPAALRARTATLTAGRMGRDADPTAVLAALDAGDLAAARAHLANRRDTAETRYLRARLAAATAPTLTGKRRAAQWREAAGLFAGSHGAGLDDDQRRDRWVREAAAHEKLKDRPAAVRILDRAAETGTTSEIEASLGHLRLVAGEEASARGHYERAVQLDPALPEWAGAMLEDRLWQLRSRLAVARFVHTHLPRIEAAVPSALAPSLGPAPVFVFWAQGPSDAPAVVRTALGQLRAAIPADRLHLLGADDITHYVDLPERVWAFADTDRAHFSDVVRAALLARYGGWWLDATCYPGPGFLDQLDELGHHDFVAFRRGSTSQISSWLLGAGGERCVIRQLDAAMHVYWQTQDRKVGYFLFHHLFECLYHALPEVRAQADEAPTLSSSAAHRLQTAMMTPSRPGRLDELVSSCFVHKLSWRLDPPHPGPDTVVAELIRTSRPVS